MCYGVVLVLTKPHYEKWLPRKLWFTLQGASQNWWYLWLIDEDTDTEVESTYVPPTTKTSPTAPQTAVNQDRKAVLNVVIVA